MMAKRDPNNSARSLSFVPGHKFAPGFMVAALAMTSAMLPSILRARCAPDSALDDIARLTATTSPALPEHIQALYADPDVTPAQRDRVLQTIARVDDLLKDFPKKPENIGIVILRAQANILDRHQPLLSAGSLINNYSVFPAGHIKDSQVFDSTGSVAHEYGHQYFGAYFLDDPEVLKTFLAPEAGEDVRKIANLRALSTVFKETSLPRLIKFYQDNVFGAEDDAKTSAAYRQFYVDTYADIYGRLPSGHQEFIVVKAFEKFRRDSHFAAFEELFADSVTAAVTDDPEIIATEGVHGMSVTLGQEALFKKQTDQRSFTRGVTWSEPIDPHDLLNPLRAHIYKYYLSKVHNREEKENVLTGILKTAEDVLHNAPEFRELSPEKFNILAIQTYDRIMGKDLPIDVPTKGVDLRPPVDK